MLAIRVTQEGTSEFQELLGGAKPPPTNYRIATLFSSLGRDAQKSSKSLPALYFSTFFTRIEYGRRGARAKSGCSKELFGGNSQFVELAYSRCKDPSDDWVERFCSGSIAGVANRQRD
jgi:hypothetical protein